MTNSEKKMNTLNENSENSKLSTPVPLDPIIIFLSDIIIIVIIINYICYIIFS